MADMLARDRLAQIIQSSGITQAEIARRVGEAPTWVSNRLTGYSALKADEIPRFADALGMDVCDLACALLRDGAGHQLIESIAAQVTAARSPELAALQRRLDQAIALIEGLYQQGNRGVVPNDQAPRHLSDQEG